MNNSKSKISIDLSTDTFFYQGTIGLPKGKHSKIEFKRYFEESVIPLKLKIRQECSLLQPLPETKAILTVFFQLASINSIDLDNLLKMFIDILIQGVFIENDKDIVIINAKKEFTNWNSFNKPPNRVFFTVRII